jgi:hypothetical protein
VIEVIAAALVGLLVGGGSVRLAIGPRRPKPKHPCPWSPCGYPLAETPLVEKPETHSTYATYASEECPGCGQVVIFNDYEGTYIRYAPKGKKKDKTDE